MPDKPKYIYVMYPIPIEDAQNMHLPFLKNEQPIVPTVPSEEDFVPLWYGNACFPEDEA